MLPFLKWSTPIHGQAAILSVSIDNAPFTVRSSISNIRITSDGQQSHRCPECRPSYRRDLITVSARPLHLCPYWRANRRTIQWAAQWSIDRFRLVECDPRSIPRGRIRGGTTGSFKADTQSRIRSRPSNRFCIPTILNSELWFWKNIHYLCHRITLFRPSSEQRCRLRISFIIKR